MQTALAVLVVLALSASSALHLSDLLGRRPHTATLTTASAWAAALANAALVVSLALRHGAPELLVPVRLVVLLSLGLATCSAAMRVKAPLRLAGALLMPVAAVLVLVHLVQASRADGVPLRAGLLLAVHISLAIVGIGTFVVAGALSALQLLQERQLRTKTFGPLFRRLPSIDELDAGAFRLVAAGFLVYSVALGLGVYQLARGAERPFDARVVFAWAAWATFAAVVAARVHGGWRGRRAATATIAGCLLACLALALYAVT